MEGREEKRRKSHMREQEKRNSVTQPAFILY